MPIQIIDPITFPDWDVQIGNLPGATIFHSSRWARVLSETYGYRPFYFTIIKNGTLSACYPVMEVDSRITGRRGVSLPFTDYCDPVASTKEEFSELFRCAKETGVRHKWKLLEIRGGASYFDSAQSSSEYFQHTLELPVNGQDGSLFSSLTENTRRNIRKAQKSGISVKILTTQDAVHQFYHLNQVTRRDHCLPPQPSHFFQNIYDHIISQGFGFVALAFFNDVPIAGAVFFCMGNSAIYKYGASDKEYQNLRPNNLVMWESIKWLTEQDCRSVSFGRTDLDHEGLRRFKLGWGTKENRISYYRYRFSDSTFVADIKKISSLPFKKIMHHTPLPVLKAFGQLMYRHMG
jgi:hypothetical protein